MCDNPENIVIFYYQNLRSQDTEGVQESTRWLSDFYKSQISISVLLHIITTNIDDYLKTHASIGLKASLQNNWQNIQFEEKKSLFNQFLDIAVNKLDGQLRSIFINSMKFSMIPEFIEIVVQIMDNTKNVNLAIEVCYLLNDCSTSPELENILMSFFQRCFSVDDVETCFMTLDLLLDSCNKLHITNLALLWDKILSIFDNFVYKHDLFKRFSIILTDFIDTVPALCDFYSLYDKIINYVYQGQNKGEEPLPTQIYLRFLNILNSLIVANTSTIQHQGLYMEIIHISTNIFFHFFNPLEESSIEDAEIIGKILESLSTIPGALSVFWQFASQIYEKDQGKYAVLIGLYETFENSGEFYVDKAEVIAGMLDQLIEHEYPCYVKKALEVTTLYGSTFTKISHQIRCSLCSKLLKMIQNNMYPELINAYTSLLASASETVTYFTVSIELVRALLDCDSFELQQTALPLLTVLISHSQSSVDSNFNLIENVLVSVLESGNPDHEVLKVQAINCLEAILRTSNYLSKSSCKGFISSCFQILISGASIKMQIACLSTINTAFDYAPHIIPEWSKEIITFLNCIVEVNLDKNFKEGLQNTQGEESDAFRDKYLVSSTALEVISRNFLSSEDCFKSNYQKYLEIIEMYSKSLETPCIKSALTSLVRYTEALISFKLDSIEVSSSILDDIFIPLLERARIHELDSDVIGQLAKTIHAVFFDVKISRTSEMLFRLIHVSIPALRSNANSFDNDKWFIMLVQLCSFCSQDHFSEIKSFTEEMMSHAKIEDEDYYISFIYIMLGYVLPSLEYFDFETRNNFCNYALDKIAYDRLQSSMPSFENYGYGAIIYLKEMLKLDKEVSSSRAKGILNFLISGISTITMSGRRARKFQYYMIITLIDILLNILPDKNNDENIELILKFLPLIDTSEYYLEYDYIIDVYNKKNGKFDRSILLIVKDMLLQPIYRDKTIHLGIQMFNLLKNMMRQILQVSPDYMQILCNDNNDQKNNIMYFLNTSSEIL